MNHIEHKLQPMDPETIMDTAVIAKTREALGLEPKPKPDYNILERAAIRLAQFLLTIKENIDVRR